MTLLAGSVRAITDALPPIVHACADIPSARPLTAVCARAASPPRAESVQFRHASVAARTNPRRFATPQSRARPGARADPPR